MHSLSPAVQQYLDIVLPSDRQAVRRDPSRIPYDEHNPGMVRLLVVRLASGVCTTPYSRPKKAVANSFSNLGVNRCSEKYLDTHQKKNNSHKLSVGGWRGFDACLAMRSPRDFRPENSLCIPRRTEPPKNPPATRNNFSA